MFGNIKQNLGKIIFFIDNCVRVVNSATSKSLVAKYTVFPHPNIHKEDWQCTHKANIVGLSGKNGFCGKTIRITYFLCVCVCLRLCSLNYTACKEYEPCYIVICDLFDVTILLNIIS